MLESYLLLPTSYFLLAKLVLSWTRVLLLPTSYILLISPKLVLSWAQVLLLPTSYLLPPYFLPPTSLLPYFPTSLLAYFLPPTSYLLPPYLPTPLTCLLAYLQVLEGPFASVVF